MRNSYYVRQGWSDSYYGTLRDSHDLERLTKEELLDYNEGWDEGERDAIIDADDINFERYHKKQK